MPTLQLASLPAQGFAKVLALAAGKKMRIPDIGMRQVYKGEIEEKLPSRRTGLTKRIMPIIAAEHNKPMLDYYNLTLCR